MRMRGGRGGALGSRSPSLSLLVRLFSWVFWSRLIGTSGYYSQVWLGDNNEDVGWTDI